MSNIEYCKKCLFPNTKPDLYFDKDGVCDACRSADRKHGVENAIDWDSRANKFEEVLAEARKKSKGVYDCLVPVSGGKDSTWQIYAMKIIHGMNPLAVTFDQFDQTETGKTNLEVLKNIGVDHIHFTLNPKIVKRLVKKGFEIVGDPYWVNHVGIYTVPFHFAVNFGIPLVVFGENSQFEYGGPEGSRDNVVMDKAWRQEFGLMKGMREEDMVDEHISIQDLGMLKFPLDKDMHEVGVFGTFYGQYFKWDASVHTELIKKEGWVPLPLTPKGSYANYENCDMKYIDIRERIKYLKFGYGRATDQLNIEIRSGRISRSEALVFSKDNDGEFCEENLNDFCKYIGISVDEYNKILDSFVNHDIFEKGKNGEWRLKNERR